MQLGASDYLIYASQFHDARILAVSMIQACLAVGQHKKYRKAAPPCNRSIFNGFLWKFSQKLLEQQRITANVPMDLLRRSGA